MKIAFALCLLAGSIAPAAAADSNGAVTVPVARTRTTNTGQDVVVPEHPTVIVSQTTIAPGGRTRTHKHPYPHYVYVLDGTLTVTDVATGRVFEVRKGGFFAEMTDTWHFGSNRGTTPVRLIAIDQVPEGTTRNMVMKSGQ